VVQNRYVVFVAFIGPAGTPDFMAERIQRIGKTGLRSVVQIIQRQAAYSGDGPDAGLVAGEGNIEHREGEGIKNTPRDRGQLRLFGLTEIKPQGNGFAAADRAFIQRIQLAAVAQWQRLATFKAV